MIPRVFHRIWLGDPLPEEFIEYGRGWAQLHPDWEMVEWRTHALAASEPGGPTTAIRALPMLNRDLFLSAARICPRSPLQFAADVVRLEILLQFGGVYLDADMAPQRSIEPILEGVELFAAWEETDRWINNAIMGAQKFDPFVTALIDGLHASVAANPNGLPNKVAGPQYLTRMVRELRPANLTIFPKHWFYPYLYNELEREAEDFPDAYAIHRWNNRRKRART